jgi:hemoglobin-like flavoprotein
MSPEQIRLVQTSWKLVEPIAEQAAELFYRELFLIDPSLESMFSGDMREQGRKLMAMLSVGVTSLSRLESIAPALRALGGRHAGYGVEPRHYSVVEAALVSTLRQGLGEEFTDEVRDAWRAAYRVLSMTMQLGAAKAAA